MSYSFSVSAATKDEAKRKVGESFDQIVVNQPPHAADRLAVVAVADAFITLLADPVEGQVVYVNVYGSLSWLQDKPDQFTAAGMTINAELHASGKRPPSPA